MLFIQKSERDRVYIDPADFVKKFERFNVDLDASLLFSRFCLADFDFDEAGYQLL
jgi:hypothetical protein